MADNGVQPAPGLPLGFEEIERLVKSLYEPGQGKKIAQTEATLRVLQRSPQGWEIADALLKSDNEQVRFFGALTLTVKLNADSAELSEDDSEQLLSTLIHHLISRPSSSIATRKVSSTLAQYFNKPISVWTQCIKSLAVSFALQQPVLDDASDSHPSAWDLFPQLSDEQLLVLLDFAMNLADEARKPSNPSNRKPHERMIANVETIEVLLQVSFGRGIKWLSIPSNDSNYDQSVQLGEKICVSALRCFTGWIFYAQSEFKEVPEKLRYLQSVNELALTCLEYQVEDAMELVAEVLERNPAFFEPKHREMLWSAISGPWGLEILQNSNAETVSLARIIVAYGAILLESKVLYKDPDNPHHQQVLSFLHDLLKYPEPVGVEDEVAPVVLEFWSNFVSLVSEETFLYVTGDELPAWMDSAKSNVFQAISELVQKIIYPTSKVTDSWDTDSRKTFKVFRIDVRDIILEAYESLRDVLTDQFIDFALRGLEASNWLELEAGLFGLISIADAFTDKVDERLIRLFERPLFSTISSNASIPAITRRTAVEAVAALNHFFLRNPRFLPQVLPFLLTALAHPTTAHSAAKSFASLCSECRKSLLEELPSFFQMYDQFLTYPTAEEFTKSMVLKGIAAIVQASDTEEKQLVGVRQLFQYVAQDAMQAISVTKEGKDAEQGQVLALTTLKCLSSIGRALQALDEEVVDLESDKEDSLFWVQGPGKEIQNQVINFVNYLTQVFPANDEIIEAACSVLRTGFKETIAGPFVLPPSAAVDFITKTTVQTPRLPYVLETACCWISSHKHSPPDDFMQQAQRLLHHDLSIMRALQHPRNDPEISVGCIELIQGLFNTNPRTLTQESPENLAGMFGFTVESISSPEVLPKRAAAKLWKDIFELAGTTHSQHQATAQDVVNHFGPAVTLALISNICGEVDYTSLDNIVAPLRAVIKADKHAKQYIISSLAGQPLLQRFQQDQGVQDMVRKFIESMMRNAKSSPAFKETVRPFWQSCKQLQMQLQPQTMHPGHRFAHGLS
ncbi:ARM repeat-containing protein [Cucurbitaria berberidis CBS 394.84]|uniref:ARM repeat-containing protein n=1 Tax=Cucurbitaria berberidis CBS 394.84 TaxID=1168544 RepID=A0A9P4GT96_9PLEO|nr:ARM repeat-containing protein [Cucurbitaria berberidis CBS 394.84]KAF1850945.1 ARM repeat-containing protein [Cucurbitaria berberidis CBS 394.84]